jgi:chaperonin GroEL (HSP60 family)
VPLTLDNLHAAFQGHDLDDDQKARVQRVRDACESAARTIMENAPQCADTTVAVRKIREARKDAVEAIALKGLV